MNTVSNRDLASQGPGGRAEDDVEQEDLTLITCIVERGEADRVVDAAIDAGAEGATIYYGRGRGVREKLGLAGLLIKPEKEVILIVTTGTKAPAVFEAVVDAAELRRVKGKGFAFLHRIDQAVGFLDEPARQG